MTGRIEMRQVDEETLERLLATAVADATPEEVMPPVSGPPGWTGERQEAFRAWHRARRPGLAGPLRQSTFAIGHEGKIVGSARLARRDGRDVLETGLWIARSQRGRGIGTATLRMLLDEAGRAGARVLVADTTTHNVAALGALRHHEARLTTDQEGDHVRARLTP